jgi:alkylhydroperoxidase/carboxymuconolactone decarboxylase family protein YurZ
MKLGATKQQIVEYNLNVIFYAGGASVANAFGRGGEVFKARSEA